MSYANQTAEQLCTGALGGNTREIPQTVREFLDLQLQDARQRVEDLCIRKARAEACGLLDYQAEQLRKFVGW